MWLPDGRFYSRSADVPTGSSLKVEKFEFLPNPLDGALILLTGSLLCGKVDRF